MTHIVIVHAWADCDTSVNSAFGNIGGIISTYSFVKEDAPFFTKGYAICVSFICLSIVTCIMYALAVTWENRKRSRLPPDSGLTEAEKIDLGVSLPVNSLLFRPGYLVCSNGVKTGSEPRVQVYALKKKKKKENWTLDVMKRTCIRPVSWIEEETEPLLYTLHYTTK